MSPIVLIALLVPQSPTVGDTIWLERSLSVPAGISVRPRPIAPSLLLDPLAPPRVVLRDQEAVIQYPIVIWRPGRHAVEIPGPILVRPDGWSDTLAAVTRLVDVASVLPAGRPPDSLAPRPAEEPISRRERSPLPTLVLLAGAGVILLPVHLWWRRRGAAPDPLPPPAPALEPETLDRWLTMGETRAALEGWSALLRSASGASGERDRILARLEEARYGPTAEHDVPEVIGEARAWLARARSAAPAGGSGA